LKVAAMVARIAGSVLEIGFRPLPDDYPRQGCRPVPGLSARLAGYGE